MTAALVLAASERTAGPLGLVVLLLMGTATVLLIRNMNSRLRRMPREFPPRDEPPAPGPDPDAAPR